jgi:hypothetical protein
MLGDEAWPELIRRAVGQRPVRSRPVIPLGGGANTSVRRAVVELRDGSTVFVKVASHEHTRPWLRDEHRVYSQLEAPFLPRLRGWYDDDEQVVLAVDDFSHAHWPPPWRVGDTAAVRATLDEVWATDPPGGLPRLAGRKHALRGWPMVADDAGPFLSLGLCSEDWLHDALPVLVDAEIDAEFDGDAFLHFDVRSDNLCIAGGRAVLVDWNLACVGNPLIDVCAWLPSLATEGGPGPAEMAPAGSAQVAAWLAGYFAARAADPPPVDGPGVRPLQLAQLRVALPWAAAALGLPPPA